MFKSRASKAAEKAAKAQAFKQDYFSNCHRTYSCIHCRAHLANHDELISKLFQGNHGRAYLFNKVVNVGCKPAVQRELLTGLHAVADIYCDSCETTLGWKYEQAFVPSQKYKEGKYIIELVHMLKENDWDLTSYNARKLLEESVPMEDERRIGRRHQQQDNDHYFNSRYSSSECNDFGRLYIIDNQQQQQQQQQRETNDSLSRTQRDSHKPEPTGELTGASIGATAEQSPPTPLLAGDANATATTTM